MQENLLMSIKTKYTNQIFNGTKIYEFRRKSIGEKNLNKKIYIYSSEEAKEIVGFIIVDKILSGSVNKLLKETEYPDKKAIREYFKDSKECYAHHIKETYKFIKPIKINEINFTVPQFYRYISKEEELYKVISKRNIIHKMKLQPKYFDYIKSGTKRIELRLYDEKRKLIKNNDRIIFINDKNHEEKLITHVKAIHRAKTFENLFNNFDISILADSSKTKESILKELNKFYTQEDQEKYGVIGLEIVTPYVLNSELNKKIIDEIYKTTKEIEKYYSDYKEWFYKKQTIKSDNRKTIYIKKDNQIIAVVNLKKDEKKLCTLYVSKTYRNQGISSILLEEAFKYLETTKPYLTCNQEKENHIKPLMIKYGWKKTNVINEEIFFNGGK